MNFVDALLEAFDLLAERLEHPIDTGLAGLGEGLALLLENLVGQVFKFLGQRLAGVGQLRHLFLEMLLALLQGGLEFGVLGRKCAQALLQLVERSHLLRKRFLGFKKLAAHIALSSFQGLGPFALIRQSVFQTVTIRVQLFICGLSLSQALT
ncbi:hypothetical protein D3C76_1217260 [compost metagenome]